MKKVLSVLLWLQCLMAAFGASENLAEDAEDCALYEGDDSASNSPMKTMYHQLSTGVVPGGGLFAATLSLSSQNSDGTCEVNMHSGIIAVSCSHGNGMYQWSPEIFKQHDTTEIWIYLGSLNDSKDTTTSSSSSSSDLAVIGRRGSLRGHLLFPSSGLQPPLTVRWKPKQKMDYYYNCVTGCLYTKEAMTSPGSHYIFLRPGRNFTQLHIKYNSTKHPTTFHELTLNSSDITNDENWKNITVVWKKQGDIGVLVDGAPLRGLERYSRLSRMSGIEAEITAGSGHLTLCNQRFKKVAAARSEEDFFNGTALPPSAASQNLQGYDVSKNWLVVLALVCMSVLLVVAIALMVLLLRTKKELQRERDGTAGEVIAVDTFGGSRTTPGWSTATVCTSGGGGGGGRGTRAVPSASLRGPSSVGTKPQAPAVPSANASQQGFNGTRT